MTLYKTDFSEYTTGLQPNDWTERWNATSGSAIVEEISGAIGGKSLHLKKTVSNEYSITWDTVGTISDCEILIRTKKVTNVGYVFARHNASFGNSYYIHGTVQLYKMVSSVQTQLGSVTKSSMTWHWHRVRLSGTQIKVKMWEDTYPEPGSWDIEVTDSSLSSGLVGVGANWWNYGDEYIDYFAVETDSESWPIPAPYKLEDFSLDLAVQANAFDYFKMLLEVAGGDWLEDFSLNLDVVAQVIDSFKMLLEVVLIKLDDFAMLLEVTDGTVFDNFAMLLDVVDGTVFDNFAMDLSVVSATPAFRSVTAHRVSSVVSEVV